ncbi:MAG: ATP-binding protein, partial [Lentisphaeria bacterium]|nr:ATP-binding protein [Lentisphaeria bacterium]
MQDLAASGESDTLELKQSTAQLGSACETLCGFLNGKGGTVLIGVTPTGKVTGQQVSDSTLQQVAAHLRRFEPFAAVDLERVALPGTDREVLALAAQAPAGIRPFCYGGRAFQRLGTTTSAMPQAQYELMLQLRMKDRFRWEKLAAENWDVARLDREAILRTAKDGLLSGRLLEPGLNDPADILRGLDLMPDGRLTNAAVVLFGREVSGDYPQCVLRLARFKGTDKTEFLDSRMVHGHAFLLFQEALVFLDRHLPIHSRILPDNPVREDRPLIPPEALREILVNALIHRSYEEPGGALFVAIYDDRVEIMNPGLLPPGISVQSLADVHPSELRNPTLANVFYRRGLIEMWGRG